MLTKLTKLLFISVSQISKNNSAVSEWLTPLKFEDLEQLHRVYVTWYEAALHKFMKKIPLQGTNGTKVIILDVKIFSQSSQNSLHTDQTSHTVLVTWPTGPYVMVKAFKNCRTKSKTTDL